MLSSTNHLIYQNEVAGKNLFLVVTGEAPYPRAKINIANHLLYKRVTATGWPSDSFLSGKVFSRK